MKVFACAMLQVELRRQKGREKIPIRYLSRKTKSSLYFIKLGQLDLKLASNQNIGIIIDF